MLQRQHLTSLFSFAFLTSLAPLSIYFLISLIEHTLLADNGNEISSPLIILLEVKAVILQGYNSFLSFSLMMITLSAIHKLVSRVIPSKSHIIENLPTTHPKESPLERETFKRMFLMMTFYGVIYFSTISFASRFGFLFLHPDDNNSSQLSLIPKTTDSFSFNSHNSMHSPFAARILDSHQEEGLFLKAQPSEPSESDIKTLSIGKTLSFLNINPGSIILSKSNKLAYVITRYIGALKIIDVSDLQYPTIIGSLDLAGSDSQYHFKTIKLSADEKTLFATTTEYLEIINVTNPRFPSLISSFKDATLPPEKIPLYFLPTIELSAHENILYIAGVGLQIFNLTEISNPKLLFSVKSLQVGKQFTMTSLALLPDNNTLAYANNSKLEFYNISDPTKPARITSYSAKISITSIALSKKDPKVLYTSGFFFTNNVNIDAVEKLNIQDIFSPQSLQFNVLGSYTETAPCIMGLSKNETNIFLTKTKMKYWSSGPLEVTMICFDFLKDQLMIQSESLLQQTAAMALIPNDKNHILVGSKERFQVLEFSADFPNSRAFCLFENLNQSLEFSKAEVLEPSSSSEGNVWYKFANWNLFESYNMTNQNSPQKIVSYKIPEDVSKSNIFVERMFFTKNRAFLLSYSKAFVLDISSSNPAYLGNLLPNNVHLIKDFQISSNDENIAFVLIKEITDDDKIYYQLSSINFTSFSSVTETIILPQFTTQYPSPKMALSNNGNLLFLVLDQLQVYNVSDPNVPQLITSQPLGVRGYNVFSLTFSPDSNVLFALMFDRGAIYTLKIFDISDLTDFKLIHALILPRVANPRGKRPFILSKDMKKGFVLLDVNLLVLDLSNLTSPNVLGVTPLGLTDQKEDMLNFFLSPDEKTGYLHTKKQVLQINLDLTYTLYLPQEKFLLGKKYSDSVMFLKSRADGDFVLMAPASYKINKLMLFNMQIVSSQNSPTMTYTPLPSWISFDSQNQILTMESKRQRDLGTYTLYSISSRKIEQTSINSLISNQTLAEDLTTVLISLGYIDNQMFLTADFGPFEDFKMPSQYATIKKQIYQLLRSYRIETFTDFNILPSLKLLSTPATAGGKFSVNTESYNSVRIDIKLFDPKAQFLQKIYGDRLHPVITENKNRIILEGPLENVNKALQELVINFNSSSSCQGEININDNLNPPISQIYKNVSEYFFKNGLPMVNASHNFTAQEQIDAVSLYTGQFFSISFDEETFMDQYSESLSYVLIPKEDDQHDGSLPSWLSFQGLTLKGTPPEEIFLRQFKFGLIIKNEFKQIEIPLVLNVKISWQFIGKLLLRLSPYILTAIGLYISANKIYNILVKKSYRHAKEFYVKAGQEINSSIIFPIRFIAEEKRKGDLILKYLQNGGTYDETAIKQAINKMPADDREKLKLSSRESSQKRVYQYVQNELIMQQLNSSQEKATKDSFESIKDKWVDFIEYDDDYGFKVNEKSLEILLGAKQNNSLLSENPNNPLLYPQDTMNLDLLKKALAVYATKNHELNNSHANLDILVHYQKHTRGFLKFFKQDLERIKYSDKGILVYGLDFSIKQNAFKINGTLDDSFEGKVLVVQIVNNHQRILKEIWIHGVPDIANDRSENSEYRARGNEYEVF